MYEYFTNIRIRKFVLIRKFVGSLMKSNTKIKVVGVGGAGGNAVSRMMKCHLEGVDFIALNTDDQDLRKCRANMKLQIGKKVTRGLGAGMNPELGRLSAEENTEQIKEILKDSDMIFVTCGLGGGTGTGAAPIVAKIAKDTGALTIAIVTKPFAFEGIPRMEIASRGLLDLHDKVDAMLVIPNDKLLNLVDKKTTLLNAFWICDDVLRQAVQGISDLILLPGIINVDFADVKAIMESAGSCMMGVGRAKGEGRAIEAARRAINSPLLDFSIEGARGLLFNVSGKEDMSLGEINEAAKVITEKISPEAKIIFGAVEDQRLRKGEIKVTVIATGFNQMKSPKNLKIFETPKILSKPEQRIEVQVVETLEEKEWEVPAFLRKKK